MKKYILPLLTIVLLFSSCEKDIEYKGSETEPMLVVNTLATSDSLLCIHVSKSCFFLDNSENYDVDKAQVEVYINDNDPVILSKSFGGYYETTTPVKEGDHIRVIVNADDFDEASGETTLPKKSNFKVTNFITTSESSRLYIELTDPSDEDVCYGVTTYITYSYIDYEDSVRYYTNRINGTTDPIFSSNSDLLNGGESVYYFTDELFHNSTINFYIELFNENVSYYGSAMKAAKFEPNIESIVVDLETMTRGTYNYLHSLDLYYDSDGFGIFSEPVQIYSNVEGGIGIIGATTSHRVVAYENPDK